MAGHDAQRGLRVDAQLAGEAVPVVAVPHGVDHRLEVVFEVGTHGGGVVSG